MSNFNNENFTSQDIYQMYVSNENLSIMDIARLTKIAPDRIYKTLKTFFEQPKNLRGYRECKDFIKKQNSLTQEIHNTQKELMKIRNEMSILEDVKKELEDRKREQLEEYYSFINSLNSFDTDTDTDDTDRE